MLDFSSLNYWAIVVVWLVYVVVGFYWYSPFGFGKLWSKLSGVDFIKQMSQEKANQAIMFVNLSAVIQAVTLAVVLNSLNVTDVMDAVKIGLLLWLGLTAATTVGNTLYAMKSWKFWWLNSSYFLVVMVLGSVILTVWK